MRRIVTWCVFCALAGFAGIVHAAPPKASSMKDLWQSLDGKCGALTVKEGYYELIIDEINPQEGKQCVISAGTDVVVFGANERGSFIDVPRQYLVVPVERIILFIRQ